MKRMFLNFLKSYKELLTPSKVCFMLLGLGISSFGVYNIHQQTNITEGGVIGMILLLNHWTGISPSILSPVLDILCYGFAFQFLGGNFIKVSIVSTLSLAGFFKLWEQFPPILPNLTNYPLAAALIGGMFVGIGVGLVVRQGGSSGGDDALALAISKSTRCRIARAYLATDITVLLFSLSYIPMNRIAYSLVTVTVSSFLIDFVQNVSRKGKRDAVKEIQEEACELYEDILESEEY
nr:YitT family protein [Anaerocolumna cellulosilytica]